MSDINDNQNNNNDANEEPKFTLYLGNLSHEAQEEDIRNLFAQFSPSDVRIKNDSQNQKRYAFVGFFNQQEVQGAIAQYDGIEFFGRQLSVSISNKVRPGDPPVTRANGSEFPPSYKTTLCRYYDGKGGGCQFGENCNFIHDDTGGGFATSGRGGFAPQGRGGGFVRQFNPGRGGRGGPSIRGRGPTGGKVENYKTVPCKLWAQGYCSFGDSCSFIHDEDRTSHQNSRNQQQQPQQQLNLLGNNIDLNSVISSLASGNQNLVNNLISSLSSGNNNLQSNLLSNVNVNDQNNAISTLTKEINNSLNNLITSNNSILNNTPLNNANAVSTLPNNLLNNNLLSSNLLGGNLLGSNLMNNPLLTNSLLGGNLLGNNLLTNANKLLANPTDFNPTGNTNTLPNLNALSSVNLSDALSKLQSTLNLNKT
jgi:RNA recognition motif-containing protein